MNNLAERTKKSAKNEFDELKQFVNESTGLDHVEVSDISYYSEKLKQKKFSISQEELRRYFPVKQVIKGLFKITKKLYDVDIKERTIEMINKNDSLNHDNEIKELEILFRKIEKW